MSSRDDHPGRGPRQPAGRRGRCPMCRLRRAACRPRPSASRPQPRAAWAGKFVELRRAPTRIGARSGELFPDAQRHLLDTCRRSRARGRIAPCAPPRELEDVDVARRARRLRASPRPARSGLSEADLGVNALGYLAQHLVVLLDPGRHRRQPAPRLPRTRLSRRRAMRCFMTGPSATADIEGVLIHGAQGVRSLKVLPIPRRG